MIDLFQGAILVSLASAMVGAAAATGDGDILMRFVPRCVPLLHLGLQRVGWQCHVSG